MRRDILERFKKEKIQIKIKDNTKYLPCRIYLKDLYLKGVKK